MFIFFFFRKRSQLLKSKFVSSGVKLLTVCWQMVYLNFYLVIVYPVKVVFAAEAPRIVINIDSDSTIANHKESDTWETVDIS